MTRQKPDRLAARITGIGQDHSRSGVVGATTLRLRTDLAEPLTPDKLAEDAGSKVRDVKSRNLVRLRPNNSRQRTTASKEVRIIETVAQTVPTDRILGRIITVTQVKTAETIDQTLLTNLMPELRP